MDLAHIRPVYESCDSVLVGFESSDDAAVIRLNDEQAMVLSVDFITPVVDDPYIFGAIAAANALSDIFAMGACAHSALNILAWDKCNIDEESVKDILRGGLDKIKESGAVLVGGHSIADSEQKYGLSVVGLAHPNHVWRNDTAHDGDCLLLTKPLGSGILSTALKKGLASQSECNEVSRVMQTLNCYAMRILKQFDVSACTDVTGFGLIGHAYEMAGGACGALHFVFDCAAIPIMGGVVKHLENGILAGGSLTNRDNFESHVCIHSETAKQHADVFFDAQTSGGLLVAMPYNQAIIALESLHKAGIEAAKIGEVRQRENIAITLG